MIEKRAVISPEDTPDLQAESDGALPERSPGSLKKTAEAADTVRRLDTQDLPGKLSHSADSPTS